MADEAKETPQNPETPAQNLEKMVFEDNEDTTVSVEPQKTALPHFELVLNDGKLAMDSATVTLRWLFPPEIIEKRPTELLIIVQREDEYSRSDWGERYLVPVKDGVTWLAFNRAGKHRITAVAMMYGKGKQDAELRGAYAEMRKGVLRRVGRRRYQEWINNQCPESHFCGLRHCLIGYAQIEVEAPDGFFAKKPRGFFGDLLWRWANLWHDYEPENQCMYRRRLIIALALKPFGYLALRTLQITLSTIACVVMLILRLGALFFGFRPKIICSDLLELLCWEADLNDLKPVEAKHDWLVWSKTTDGQEKTFTPPIAYVLMAAAVYGIYSWFQSGLPWAWLLLWIVGSLAFAGAGGYLVFKLSEKIMSAQENDYGRYLDSEFSAARRAELLARKPKTGLVRKLVMSCEARIAKWCKPFEQ